jgi:Domain of unknown function (DUF4760)
LVIAGTAIAAIVQLRHARSSNQIEALAELRQENASSEMEPAQRFVRYDLREKIKDPAFRHQLANPETLTTENRLLRNHINRVGNYYEGMGTLVKSGLADKDLVLDSFSSTVLLTWNLLAPVVAIVRQSLGDRSIWENFEYPTVLSQDWETTYPNGTYPAGVRRIDLEYAWLEAAMQYAASLAPA